MQKTLNLALIIFILASDHTGYAMIVPAGNGNGTYLVHRTAHVPHQTPQQQVPTTAVRVIEQPELLLKVALDQNHPDKNKLIKYIVAIHGDHYTASVLHQAIDAGNREHVQTLIDNGFEPQAMHTLRPVLLQRALRVFSPHDDPNTTAGRLAILEMLVDSLDAQHVPAAFEVDLCHGKGDARHIPELTRIKVAGILNKKHIPIRLCMDDEIHIYDPNIGIADVDLFEEEQDRRFWFPASPLHEATLKGDYAQCIALLTTFKEPVLQNEVFPIEALIKTSVPRHEVSDKEYQEAAAIMTKFNARMHLKLDKQFTHVHSLRALKDHKGRTAYDIARAANAPTEIVQLLDPHNNKAIKQILSDKLNAIFMDNLARAQALAQQAQAQRIQLQKVQEQILPQQLKVGDKIIINGLEYTVTDTQKSK